MIIPVNWINRTGLPNKSRPTIITNKGVVAFNTPAIELFKVVSAIQKRIPGKKLPSNPIKTAKLFVLAFVFFQALEKKGVSTIPALNNLKAATSKGLSATNPSFIRIKELPQTRQSSKNISH